MLIQEIKVEDTLYLRQKILRPTHKIEELVGEWDDIPVAIHFGAFVEGKLVGTASFLKESRGDDETEWRLRGMATEPEYQKRGLGRALILAGIAHIKANQGGRIWCHARESALGFYSKLGFMVTSDRFQKPSGPHFIMETPISS